MNHYPTTAIDLKTPNEVWFGNLTDYFNLNFCCCLAYLYVNEGKLKPKEKNSIFNEYASGVKGFQLWCTNPKSPKFVVNIDVVFVEQAMLSSKKE